MNDSGKLAEERVAKLVEVQVYCDADSISGLYSEGKHRNLKPAGTACRQTFKSYVKQNQAPPEMADSIGNNIQCINVSANSAGNYHMGNANSNYCITSVCSNAISQPNANNISIYDLLL